MGLQDKDMCPSKKEAKEIGKGIEAYDAWPITAAQAQAWADAEGLTEEEMEVAETIFDHVDANDNGEISKDEAKAAFKWMMSHCHPKKEAAFLKLKTLAKATAKQEDDGEWECPTAEEEDQIMAALEHWLPDGVITKEEAVADITAWLAEAGEPPLTDEEWAELDALFNYLDADQSGGVTEDELVAAWEMHEEEYREHCPAEAGPPKKGGKGKKRRKRQRRQEGCPDETPPDQEGPPQAQMSVTGNLPCILWAHAQLLRHVTCAISLTNEADRAQ